MLGTMMLAGIGMALMRNPRRRRKSRRRSRNPGASDPRSGLYNERRKPPKFNSPVSVISAPTVGSAIWVFKRVFGNTLSKAQHGAAASHYRQLALRAHRIWNKTHTRAVRETFGRAPRALEDHRVSGVGRDEFSARHKNILRMAAQRASAYERIAQVHAKLAGASERRIRKLDEPNLRANPRKGAKTYLARILQSYYPGAGWSDVLEEETSREMKAQLKTYRENDPGTPYRVIRRRVPIETPPASTYRGIGTPGTAANPRRRSKRRNRR